MSVKQASSKRRGTREENFPSMDSSMPSKTDFFGASISASRVRVTYEDSCNSKAGFMRLDIRGVNVPVTEAIRKVVEHRLSFALSRFANRISRVTVRLVDVNGPKGGKDKKCLVTTVLIPTISVVVEDVDPDLYVAIDRAMDRLGRVVGRRLKRLSETQAEQDYGGN